MSTKNISNKNLPRDASIVFCVHPVRRGRRLSLVVFLFAQCLFGMLAAVSPNLIAFICLRFLVAVGTAGTWSSLTKLVEDLVGGGQRARALLLARCALSVGFLLVALVALLVRDWSYLAATTSVPFVTFLFYWRILPESPKWLLAHGRFNRAAQLMLIIAHTNTKHIPRDYLTALQEDASSHQIACGERDTSNLLQQFVDLCGTKETNRRIFLLLGIGLVNGVASLAQVYLAVGLAGNAYLHMLLMSSADLSACLAPLMMLKHSGCRKIAILGCISGGVTCFAHFVTSRRGHPCISLCLLAMSKVSVGSSLAVVPLWLHEISPSSQQAVVAHLAQTAELAAFAVVPLLFQQEDPELTPVVLSVLLIGGGILLTFDMHHPGRSWCLRKLRSRVGSWSCNRNKGMVYRSNAWEFKSLQNPSPIPSLVKRQEALQMCPNFHPLQGVDTIKVTVV
ncbi:uncharacterized protein ISCGN_000333 [Ixodes scapularis]